MPAGVQRLPWGLTSTGLTILLLVAATLSVMVGSVAIAPDQVWRIVGSHLLGGSIVPDWTPAQDAIVWNIRAPRAMLAIAVGGTLGIVGCTLQAMGRNPLAEPAILGGSTGASLGAVTVLLFEISFLGAYTLIAAAFAGAALGYTCTWLLAQRGGGLMPLRLVLSGVAVSYLFGALTSFVVLRVDNPQRVQAVIFWSLGSLSAAQWSTVLVPALLLLAGVILLFAFARPLDALAFGEETATSLGVSPAALRRRLFVITALLTGSAVALTGVIGFVGLIIPHAVRLLVRTSSHRLVLPLSALAGAAFLLFADVVARVAIAPSEMPIGLVTALVGAPVFAALLRTRMVEPGESR